MTALAPINGGFEEADMHHVLDRACAVAGLDSSGARLLRGHTNAVILLAHAPVVVKIARRGSRSADVERTVRFVRFLIDHGFPTVPLYCDAIQPVVIDGHPVTFWAYLPQPDHPVAAAQLAKPLYALHTLPVPALSLPRHDNVRAIRFSIAATTSLSRRTLRYLTDRVDRLEAELGQVEFLLPEGVLQGDPQHRNALHDDKGDAVLCDWDTVALGQPEWDLVTVEVHCRRFGYGQPHYQEFADSYGYDVTRWPGYATLRDLRELRMITTNARKAMHAPPSLAEVERRVAGLRDEAAQLRWNIL
ncbi:phosphotransferase family protein [Streptomyces sp. A5-4]|uniref:phosphotransferase family protein n=1 Tax=Streptomyces sp. A5-4 TaxID=3384771 RepID=UPI003DA864D6